MDCKQILRVFGVLLSFLVVTSTALAQAPDFPDRMPIVERPFSEDPDKFTFAIIGDKTGGGRDKWHIFDRAINEINSLQPDFAIMVGDLIQGVTTDIAQLDAEWEEFWQHESPLAVPFLPLPGNHDITNPVMYDYWVEHLGRTYSAFTYKDCLFLILNTEERHGLPQGVEDWFGEAQIRYAAEALERHPDVRHTFVLLHKPAWLHEGSGWDQIEEMLGARAYTVFAGHYHNLTLHTRNDRRYFVLGATGGGLTPREVREFGAFDHYSIVTVDGDDVTVAIVEPGSIHPADISTAAFKEEFGDLLTVQPDFEVDRAEPVASGKLGIELKNRFEKLVKVEIAFDPSDNWQITPNQLTFEVKPGQETESVATFLGASDALLPLPTYHYSILYGGEQLYNRSEKVKFVDEVDLHALKDWQILGPFDLGMTERPTESQTAPPQFIAEQLPEEDSSDKTYSGKNGQIHWQEHHADSEVINLNKALGDPDWAFAYAVTYIKSPDDRTVFAQIRWGSELGRLSVNGVEIQEASVPEADLFFSWAYVELPLKAGWNTVMVKSADYTGGWHYRMWVENQMDTLVFSHEMPH